MLHRNPDTNKIGRCKAEKGNCPFTDPNDISKGHYETQEEMDAYLERIGEAAQGTNVKEGLAANEGSIRSLDDIKRLTLKEEPKVLDREELLRTIQEQAEERFYRESGQYNLASLSSHAYARYSTSLREASSRYLNSEEAFPEVARSSKNLLEANEKVQALMKNRSSSSQSEQAQLTAQLASAIEENNRQIAAVESFIEGLPEEERTYFRIEDSPAYRADQERVLLFAPGASYGESYSFPDRDREHFSDSKLGRKEVYRRRLLERGFTTNLKSASGENLRVSYSIHPDGFQQKSYTVLEPSSRSSTFQAESKMSDPLEGVDTFVHGRSLPSYRQLEHYQKENLKYLLKKRKGEIEAQLASKSFKEVEDFNKDFEDVSSSPFHSGEPIRVEDRQAQKEKLEGLHRQLEESFLILEVDEEAYSAMSARERESYDFIYSPQRVDYPGAKNSSSRFFKKPEGLSNNLLASYVSKGDLGFGGNISDTGYRVYFD